MTHKAQAKVDLGAWTAGYRGQEPASPRSLLYWGTETVLPGSSWNKGTPALLGDWAADGHPPAPSEGSGGQGLELDAGTPPPRPSSGLTGTEDTLVVRPGSFQTAPR